MDNVRGFRVVMVAFVLGAIAGAGLAAQDRGLAVVARSVAGQDYKIGKQYAVLIAVDRYQKWTPLRNPVSDAKAVKSILQKRYYIDEFVELYDGDATAVGIRRLFADLIARTGPSDSVLIYYAGHGYTDQFKTGFWIPADGGNDVEAQDRWIPNQQIRNFVSQMKARSVALVADSCFSGDLLNVSRGAAPTLNAEYYKAALKYRARQVLTSGASETVPDESEFARQFRTVLESNTEVVLDPVAMYDRIRRGVTKTLPLLGTLPGQETGGSFALFLKGSGTGPVESVAPYSAGTLAFNIWPLDATVLIDGIKVALSSGRYEAKTGTHTLTVSAHGYFDASEIVEVGPGSLVPVNLRLKAFEPANITIPSPSWGSVLLLDDTEAASVGRDSTQPNSLNIIVPSGRPVSLEISVPFADSLDDPKHELMLEPGSVHTVPLPVGRFAVPWLPEGATFEFASARGQPVPLGRDGKGLVSPALAAGQYTVQLSGPYSYTGQVHILAGQTVELPDYKATLTAAMDARRLALATRHRSARGRKTAGWVTLGTGFLGSAVTATAWALGSQVFDDYNHAATTADALALRDDLALYGTLAPVGLTTAVLGFGLTPILWSRGPDPATLQTAMDALDALDASLKELRGE